MVEVVDVVKTFPQRYGVFQTLGPRGRTLRRHAVNGLSFRVERGETFGLVGENGSGKSTALRMLASLIVPDTGTIVVDGIDAAKHPIRARARTGLSTGDDRSFFFRLTARQNLELYAGLSGVDRSLRTVAIREAAVAVDLTGDLERRFSDYSSGMRQRLGIARALLADPDVLLLDEPTRAVDPDHAERLRAVIRDLARKGKTIIVATNLLDDVWSVCDRVAILNRGRAITIGRTDELRRRATGSKQYAIGVDALDEAIVDQLYAVDGVTNVQCSGVRELLVRLAPTVRDINPLLRAINTSGLVVTSLTERETSPAELFRALIQERPNDG